MQFAASPDGPWAEIYRDGMGEADIRILLRQFLEDRDRADAAARGWDGDVYRLLEGPTGEVLVWVSRWDAPDEAAEFARAVEQALAVRYDGVDGRSVRVERPGARSVRVVDTPSGADYPPAELFEVEADR